MRHGGNGRVYTADEIAIIHANPHLTAKQLAALLPGRTAHGLVRYRAYHDLPRMKPGLPAEILWSADEMRILRENAHLTSTKLAPLLPKRTARTIQRKRSREALAQDVQRDDSWTEAEIAILKANGHLSARKVAALLPGRTQGAIKTLRRKRNLPRPSPKVIGVPWSSAEAEILRTHGHLRSTQFGELLPGRTSWAIRAYRQDHDLPAPKQGVDKGTPPWNKGGKVPNRKPARVKSPKPPKLRVVRPAPVRAPKPEPVVVTRDLRPGERRCTALLPQPGGLFRKCTNPVSKGPVCPSCQAFFRRSA